LEAYITAGRGAPRDADGGLRPQNPSFQKTNKLAHPLGKEMTRFIVVLGTTSHSGKSTIVAALCRILKNRGLKVAPFKSQNMSLNSWVTSEGREMGIAQAVQAEAAGVEPTELMNPILLKPKGDRTSQVIVFGVPVADKSAEEYYREIDGLKAVVDRALEELEKEYIAYVLKVTEHNLKKAAEVLSISRTTLYNKLAKYGLPRD